MTNTTYSTLYPEISSLIPRLRNAINTFDFISHQPETFRQQLALAVQGYRTLEIQNELGVHILNVLNRDDWPGRLWLDILSDAIGEIDRGCSLLIKAGFRWGEGKRTPKFDEAATIVRGLLEREEKEEALRGKK
ncbi:hypothetical protein PtrSN002B_011501 [Pyrenophora tritici-repentis]|uniref:Uncharacterized protein n=2 Tax=Pyrenophora tritici-repentis TaxID=45151 RepID=A0A2W1D8L4_9PLEO|nr:uncharacterized protein PTRG_06679 [Pyrenophora tritici-repentis Pt-1C-BFP]KAA8613782.1 hypothetical protein PtrV1_12690 [Pyrenophora tritici-repentis]EDU49599.1 predicted protein [Pyrenophora tritici-repentis Pt-1C-BFP]KAF7445502.1 hypothetical protein A1F99_104880 [Pyrenophora tritici-repentis]KAF7565784.1 hypothetical protein PtrM4_052180 [Pyrenophora tritici-repentis]KAG9380118.1 hypothetical protein A1F94_009013 [Pyrenophora tritici-repentis]